jgi:hypothetical protein
MGNMADHIVFEGLTEEEREGLLGRLPLRGGCTWDHWYYLIRDQIPNETFFHPDSNRNLAVYYLDGEYLGFIDISTGEYIEDGKKA